MSQSLKNLFLCLLFLSVFTESSSFNFRQKLNKAIEKGKSFYKSKYGKDKTWHFLGHDASEYPGTGEELRKIQMEKWDDYYVCLAKQENNIGEHGSVIAEAVLAFEGESIKFECKVCISPSEQDDVDFVEWEWSHLDGKYLELVDYGEHILLSPEDKTLHIYNLGAAHTGQYVCKLGKQLTAPYFLTVVNSSEPLRMVQPKSAPNGLHPERPWKIHPEIILDTMWGHWSACSKCGAVGRRHKYGYCVIILLSNVHELELATNNSSSNNTELLLDEDLENTNFIDLNNISMHLSQQDRQFLQIFKYGIPCRSHILPSSLRNIKYIRERQSEIMTGYCKIKCATDEVFVVKDKNGYVIETANNSAGIYSTLQGLPPVQPPVERRLQFESADTDIVLTCPGNLNSDVPIQWQIGSKNVVPSLLAKESEGRLYVSITNRIHIGKSKETDSNIYSCWQNKELAGTIRLIVEKRIKLNVNHHFILVGIILIMSTFVYVYIKSFIGRKYTRLY